MPSSRSWCGDAPVGASVRGQWAVWVLGKAITSRMDSAPASSITMRSSPNAIPPCGGHPYWSDSSRKPNFSTASSSPIPSTRNAACCISGR